MGRVARGVTTRQRLALQRPCARADEALWSEFRRAMRVGAVSLSTILTVNK